MAPAHQIKHILMWNYYCCWIFAEECTQFVALNKKNKIVLPAARLNTGNGTYTTLNNYILWWNQKMYTSAVSHCALLFWFVHCIGILAIWPYKMQCKNFSCAHFSLSLSLSLCASCRFAALVIRADVAAKTQTHTYIDSGKLSFAGTQEIIDKTMKIYNIHIIHSTL